MKDLFLAKILLESVPSLILTDGTYFGLLKGSFSEFLAIKNLTLKKKQLKFKLPKKITFLDLIEEQNIFATGCTYKWEKEKINSTPDNDVYKKLYFSDQSMFFYKGNKNNMAEFIGIRKNAKITIPEAELVAVFNRFGKIIGYTLGNDVTALDLERKNPLYQGMAKFYKGSVSILPLIKLGKTFPKTNLICEVFRKKRILVKSSYYSINFIKSPQKIVEQLMESNLSNNGGFLFLGCGVSYPTEFGLISGDTVIIKSDMFPFHLKKSCFILQ